MGSDARPEQVFGERQRADPTGMRAPTLYECTERTAKWRWTSADPLDQMIAGGFQLARSGGSHHSGTVRADTMLNPARMDSDVMTSTRFYPRSYRSARGGRRLDGDDTTDMDGPTVAASAALTACQDLVIAGVVHCDKMGAWQTRVQRTRVCLFCWAGAGAGRLGAFEAGCGALGFWIGA